MNDPETLAAQNGFSHWAQLNMAAAVPLEAVRDMCASGRCTLCARCTYPDRPCRYPTKRLSSMEAYGLFVSDICTRSGLAYNYGPRTMTYTSCVLYNKE